MFSGEYYFTLVSSSISQPLRSVTQTKNADMLKVYIKKDFDCDLH